MSSKIPETTRHYVLPDQDHGYQALKIKEDPVKLPRANEVLVKVHAVSLQYRDLAISKGKYRVAIPNVTPCSDMAGEVLAVGETVKEFKIGDRVCANFTSDHVYADATEEVTKTSLGGQSHGVLTQCRSFPAHSLVHVPNHLNYLEASTLPCAALTAYNALDGPSPLKAGDTVLVQGTGGVSIFALQFAVASGATVIATSSSDAKLERAKSLGATHVINYKKNPKWDKEVLKLTNDAGVDRVIEVGGTETLPLSINAVRNGGQIPMIGFLSGVAPPGSDFKFVELIFSRALTLRGIYIGSVAQFKDMNKLIAANPEKTRPVIDKVFPFDDAKQAYAHLESQKHLGKVVIKVAE